MAKRERREDVIARLQNQLSRAEFELSENGIKPFYSASYHVGDGLYTYRDMGVVQKGSMADRSQTLGYDNGVTEAARRIAKALNLDQYFVKTAVAGAYDDDGEPVKRQYWDAQALMDDVATLEAAGEAEREAFARTDRISKARRRLLEGRK